MKVLGVIGIIVSVISLSFGLHLHFAYAKAVDIVNKQIDSSITERGLDFLQSQEYRDLFQLAEFKTTYGMLVMVLGAVSTILCIFPAARKFNIAWFGVVFGLTTFILGALHGAHLFD